MKILIIKLGAIGDVVHTLPALAAIRDASPANTEIAWVVERRSAEILRENPLIERLIEIDTRALRKTRIDRLIPELRSQLRSVRSAKFDVAIDFQGLLKSGAIAKLSGARERWGFSRADLREPASRAFLTDTVKIPPRTSVIRKNLLLAAATIQSEFPAERRLRFPITTNEDHRREAASIAARIGANFALINPAGGWATKLWPAENFGSLANLLWRDLALPAVVATGPGEDGLAERVRSITGENRVIFVQPSLKGFYELAKLATVYVGGDTGPTHLAVAAGAPVVGLFGPTEWWRNGSPDPADICVERTDIGCRTDCHRRSCSQWICMDIDVARVLSAVKIRIERAKDPGRASKPSV